MVEYLLILSLVRITEFLPISSSAHLMILNLFSEASDQSVSVDLSLHIAHFCFDSLFFTKPLKSKKIANFNSDFLSTRRLLSNFIQCIANDGICIYFLNYNTIYIIRENIHVIICNLIFAILLFFGDYFGKKSNKLTKRNLVFLSVFQSISLIPGVSRSGIA